MEIDESLKFLKKVTHDVTDDKVFFRYVTHFNKSNSEKLNRERALRALSELSIFTSCAIDTILRQET